MTKRISIIVIAAIILGLIIGLPFAFDNSQIVESYLAFYIIDKAVFGILFILAVVWSTLAKRARGTIYILLVTAGLLQFIPALARLAPLMKSFGLPFDIIMLALGLIIAAAMFFMLNWTSKKQLESDENYEGDEIPVVEEKTVLEENDK